MLEYPKRKITMYQKKRARNSSSCYYKFYTMRCGASQFKNDCVLNADKSLFEKGYEQVILNSYFEWFFKALFYDV